MKSKASVRRSARQMRQQRVRKNVRGTCERPRLCVFKSLRYTYVQLVSDDTGSTLATASTKGLALKSASSVESAKSLGQKIAELAKEKNIASVVFDRNGYVYHGRIAAVAEGAREAGLNF